MRDGEATEKSSGAVSEPPVYLRGLQSLNLQSRENLPWLISSKL